MDVWAKHEEILFRCSRAQKLDGRTDDLKTRRLRLPLYEQVHPVHKHEATVSLWGRFNASCWMILNNASHSTHNICIYCCSMKCITVSAGVTVFGQLQQVTLSDVRFTASGVLHSLHFNVYTFQLQRKLFSFFCVGCAISQSQGGFQEFTSWWSDCSLLWSNLFIAFQKKGSCNLKRKKNGRLWRAELFHSEILMIQ